jgi:hypothetical protein
MFAEGTGTRATGATAAAARETRLPTLRAGGGTGFDGSGVGGAHTSGSEHTHGHAQNKMTMKKKWREKKKSKKIRDMGTWQHDEWG